MKKTGDTCRYLLFFGAGKRTWSLPTSIRWIDAKESPAAILSHKSWTILIPHKKAGDTFRYLLLFGAGKRTWTFMKEPSLEPESSASTNSAIPAGARNGTWTHMMKSHAPQTCASTNSAILAYFIGESHATVLLYHIISLLSTPVGNTIGKICYKFYVNFC